MSAVVAAVAFVVGLGLMVVGALTTVPALWVAAFFGGPVCVLWACGLYLRGDGT